MDPPPLAGAAADDTADHSEAVEQQLPSLPTGLTSAQVGTRFRAGLESLGRLHEEEVSILRSRVIQLEEQLGQAVPSFRSSEAKLVTSPEQAQVETAALGATDAIEANGSPPSVPVVSSFAAAGLEQKSLVVDISAGPTREGSKNSALHARPENGVELAVSAITPSAGENTTAEQAVEGLLPGGIDPVPTAASATIVTVGVEVSRADLGQDVREARSHPPNQNGEAKMKGTSSTGSEQWLSVVGGPRAVEKPSSPPSYTHNNHRIPSKAVSPAPHAATNRLASPLSSPPRSNRVSLRSLNRLSMNGSTHLGEHLRGNLRGSDGSDFRKRGSSLYEESTLTELLNPCEIKAGPIAHWARLVQQATHQAMLNCYELGDVWVRSDNWLRQVRWNNPGVDLWGMSNTHDFAGRAYSRKAVGGASGNKDIDIFWLEEAFSHARFRKTLIKSVKEHTMVTFIENQIVLDPQSRCRIMWAAIGVTLMLYDLVMLPMQAFELPENALSTFVAWFSQFFWTLDIFLSFFTGVYINTELVKRLGAIAKSYAKSWLLFDVLVVTPIWLVMLLGTESSTTNSLQAFKYVRMLRFMRLLRLAKFSRMLGEALAGINSPVIMLVLGMVKLMGCMAVLSHVNACLWYAAGQASSDGWTKSYSGNSTLYQYLASMHWALTQFQGTSEITVGGSAGERAYAVVTVLLSMLILSTFVSSLTNMMMQLQALQEQRTVQQRAVRCYLSSNSISNSLSSRVKQYIEWKQKHQKKSKDDEEVMQLLPIQLMMDLQEEVRGPVLAQHKFLRMFRFVYPRLTRRVTHMAVQQLNPAPDELIFSAQESSTRMYFVLSGELKYTLVRRKTCNTTVRLGDQVLTQDQYLSEAALWMHWQHRGDLVVTNFANLLTIVSLQFQSLIQTHPPAYASCVLYARRYINAIARVEWWSITDIVKPECLIEDHDHPMLEKTKSTLALYENSAEKNEKNEKNTGNYYSSMSSKPTSGSMVSLQSHVTDIAD